MVVHRVTTARAAWAYCIALLVFWVFDSEMRRLLDWHGGFHASQVLSVVPLVALGAFAFATTYRGRLDVSSRMLALAWIWLGAFSYALAVGWLIGRGASAVYDFVQFVAPMFIAIWLAAGKETTEQAFRRIAAVILAIAVAVSAYGLVQFVLMPPWDASWMRGAMSIAGMTSIGRPHPFEVRVFSVLNSPEPCGAFLAAAIAFNLYRLNEKRLLPLAGMGLCVITLALTLVRSAWIASIVALVVYVAFSPRPRRALGAGFAVAVLVAGFFAFVSPWVAERAGHDVVAQRVQTFANLGGDSSARARIASTEDLLNAAVAYPIGEGLGMIGTAAQLSSVTQSVNSVDGGLQARLVEMGFAGFLGYVAALFCACVFVAARWQRARRSGDRTECEIMSVLLAVQAALIALDVSVDSHVNLTGALFWLTVGIALSPRGADARPDSGANR